MNLLKNNLSYRRLTPLRISLFAIAVLMVSLLWQQMLLLRKNHTITVILSENADLKESLSYIDDQLLELKDTTSDVRLFQRELIKVIKDIDQSYPVTFAAAQKAKAALTDELPGHNRQFLLDSARENIFKLSSAHENLRFETAGLLGKALSMRNILDKTPSMFPVNGGHISSDFGIRLDPFTGKQKQHNGIDIAAAIGTPVFASASGTVIFVGEKKGGFGNEIEIRHDKGFSTQYGHLSKILIKKGDFVKRGKVIGLLGNTGRCLGNHLHLGVKQFGVPIDPKPFMISSPPNIF